MTPLRIFFSLDPHSSKGLFRDGFNLFYDLFKHRFLSLIIVQRGLVPKLNWNCDVETFKHFDLIFVLTRIFKSPRNKVIPFQAQNSRQFLMRMVCLASSCLAVFDAIRLKSHF